MEWRRRCSGSRGAVTRRAVLACCCLPLAAPKPRRSSLPAPGRRRRRLCSRPDLPPAPASPLRRRRQRGRQPQPALVLSGASQPAWRRGRAGGGGPGRRIPPSAARCGGLPPRHPPAARRHQGLLAGAPGAGGWVGLPACKFGCLSSCTHSLQTKVCALHQPGPRAREARPSRRPRRRRCDGCCRAGRRRRRCGSSKLFALCASCAAAAPAESPASAGALCLSHCRSWTSCTPPTSTSWGSRRRRQLQPAERAGAARSLKVGAQPARHLSQRSTRPTHGATSLFTVAGCLCTVPSQTTLFAPTSCFCPATALAKHPLWSDLACCTACCTQPSAAAAQPLHMQLAVSIENPEGNPWEARCSCQGRVGATTCATSHLARARLAV